MAARPTYEDDGDGSEMDSLQSNGKRTRGSSEDSQEDTEQQGDAQQYDSGDKSAAYTKLYGIVTVMTLLLFALNIAQVCLLPVVSNLYWIVLFPGIVFIMFLAWAWLFVATNRQLFFGHLGSMGDERRRAFQHLAALFVLRGRSQRAREYTSAQPGWPRRFARAGVFLTIFLNIILCQFIYLPVFAVPAFQEITLKMELNASSNISTPSFALIQNTELARRATLEGNETSIREMCDWKMSDDIFKNLFCFRDRKEFSYGMHQQHHAQYVTFDGSHFPNISVGTSLGLWYQYSYNSTASRDPLLALVALDTTMLPVFEKAFRCGIIAATSFPARERNRASLHRVTINDPFNAMDRAGDCIKAFEQYNIYEPDITPLGAPSAPGQNNCDLAEDANLPWNGSCNAGITVAFPSTLTRVYTSEHGKDWITILTEEGGVVGFVTFLAWFFGIFAM